MLLLRYARLRDNLSRADFRDTPRIRYRSFSARISSITARRLLGVGAGGGDGGGSPKSEASDDDDVDADA